MVLLWSTTTTRYTLIFKPRVMVGSVCEPCLEYVTPNHHDEYDYVQAGKLTVLMMKNAIP